MTTTDIVNTWFRERIATGAVARDTEAHNQVHAALFDLIARIDADAAPDATGKATEKSPPAPAK